MLVKYLLKVFVISTILFLNTQIIYPTKLDAAEELLDTPNSILIEETIAKAVNDTRWFNAASEKEVETILDDYYAGSLLDTLTTQTWEFVQQCTDWHYQVFVEKVKIISLTDETATATAFLRDEDLFTGNKNYGLAIYNLKRTTNNWKIISNHYKWN